MLKFLKSNLFFFLLLTVIVFSLYGKSIFFDFVSDEFFLISDKVDFLSDIKNIPKLFTTSAFYLSDCKYYRPVLNLSFLIEISVFGLNKKICHTTNIILFILTLWLMYVFLIKLKLNETILKFLILLVAVHPIFTSSVVWIPARNDTLLAIFVYLSFIFFINYLENKQIKNFIFYLIFFSFAVFTKESAILIIFLYFLFMWIFNYKLNKNKILKNIFFIFVVIFVYLFFRSVAVLDENLFLYFSNLNRSLKNMFDCSLIYLYQFVIPNINVMMYNCKLNINHFIVLILSISFVIYCLLKKIIDKKIFIWCFISFIFFILPTTFSDDYIILNHRLVTVIPAIIIPITLFVDKIINLKNIKKYLFLVFIILFVIYAVISFGFQDNYKNREIHSVKKYIIAPNWYANCYSISRLYFEKGNFEKAKEFLQKANQYGNNRYLSDLALIYCYEGKFNEAEDLYNKSIQNGINRAQCYRNLSFIYFQRDNNINKALEYAKLAVKDDPYNSSYRQYLEELGKKQNEL